MGKIYTKKGDQGETSLFNGVRVSKDDLRIKSLGALDELNSSLGVEISLLQENQDLKEKLSQIQSDLMLISSILADSAFFAKADYLTSQTSILEDWIDQMEEDLPKLTHFILPGGSQLGAWLQFTRTICRRAEREVVELSLQSLVSEAILAYLNRLSDLLFVLSRFINFKAGFTDIPWKA